MPTDRFLIAPFNTGLQLNLKPWLILDDAFALLENAYVFRGRVRKRFGTQLMGNSPLTSRLRVQVGIYGTPVSPVPPNKYNIGQMFSVGNDMFTVYQTGTPASMLSTNTNATGTFNTSTGAFAITYSSGAPSNTTPIYWYPALPVMGLTQYAQGAINNQPSYAFDTQFAYVYNGTAWQRSGSAAWQGTNLNFFDVANWEGITPNVITMFVTNFNFTLGTSAPAATDDPIWYTTDGSTWVSMAGGIGGVSNANGIFFLPKGLAPYEGSFVQTSRLIVAFKNRLLLLNTVENNNSSTTGTGTATLYVNRCRYSFNGSPLAVNAWYEPNTFDSAGNIAAGAGWIDATTQEAIVSAEFIKDRLIVFFERSTWELAYTGNEKQPFIWQKINTELGSESQMSSVPFDKEILTIGQTGVHSCNGANVTRIDSKIPDVIFELKSANLAPQRVSGIRDYFSELVYWNYPSANEDPNFQYPNRILVYNYQNGSWSVNLDTFTVFGYFEQATNLTWASSPPLTWEEANFSWQSGQNQQGFRQVIAGNQEGFVLVIRPDFARNAPSLQITNITQTGIFLTLTIIANQINADDFIYIENAVGPTNLNGYIYKVYGTNSSLNQVVIVATAGYTGPYYGGGTVARVSNIDIRSKQWNPYDKIGRDVYLAKIDFAVQNTGRNGASGGQVTVDYFPSSSDVSMLEEAEPDTLMGTGVLETGPYPATLVPLEQYQERLWHTIYFQSEGTCIQTRIYMSDAQMFIPQIALSDFVLEGLVLHTRSVSYRLQ